MAQLYLSCTAVVCCMRARIWSTVGTRNDFVGRSCRIPFFVSLKNRFKYNFWKKAVFVWISAIKYLWGVYPSEIVCFRKFHWLFFRITIKSDKIVSDKKSAKLELISYVGLAKHT